MVRRLRSALSFLLSAALMALNPGWTAAAVVVRAKLGPGAPLGKTAVVSSIPTLTISPAAPLSVLKPGPFVLPGQKLSIPELSLNVAPHIELINEAGTGAEASYGSGSSIQALLEGSGPSEKASLSDPVRGSEFSGHSPLYPSYSKKPRLPAVEEDYGAYGTRRRLLRAAAAKGVVASLPKAGKGLANVLIKEARSRKAVFLTLSEAPSGEILRAVSDLRQAGKAVVLVVPAADMLKSLESEPAAALEGMTVIVHNGGEAGVYRYDSAGSPAKVWEAPAADVSPAVSRAASELKLQPGDVVVIGGSFYAPQVPATPAAGEQELKEEAERLSGSPIPEEGAGTALAVERGLPGAMVLAVDGAADPRLENGWALEISPLRLLRELSKPAPAPEKPATALEKAGTAALFVALLGAAGLAYYSFWKIFIDIASGNISAPANPDEIYYGPIPTWEEIFMGMGGILSYEGMRKRGAELKGSKTLQVVAGMALGASAALLGLPYLLPLGAATAAAGLALAYHGYKNPWAAAAGMAMMTAGATMMVAGPSALLAGVAAVGGIMMQPNVMPNPSRDFALALEQAVKTAAKYGYTDDQVYFGGATASLPRRDGREWSYSFYFSRDLAKGPVALAYVDILTGWTSTPDFRVSYFQSVESPLTLSAVHELKLEHGPEQALDAVRGVEPLFGSRVSMELSPLGAYTIYDERGGKATVDAKTKQVSVLQAPPPVIESSAWSRGRVITLSIFLGLALLWLEPKLLWAAGAAGGLYLLFKALGAKSSIVEDRGTPPGVTDADIESAAKSVIAYKGRPWSQTEYNMGYYNAHENLEKRGATPAQLERFKKLCDEAPVKGGGFNPWSGD